MPLLLSLHLDSSYDNVSFLCSVESVVCNYKIQLYNILGNMQFDPERCSSVFS